VGWLWQIEHSVLTIFVRVGTQTPEPFKAQVTASCFIAGEAGLLAGLLGPTKPIGMVVV
jgi:hypothetical protein